MVMDEVEQGSTHHMKPQLSLMEMFPASLLWGSQLLLTVGGELSSSPCLYSVFQKESSEQK